ncbi:hypothetical protein CI109_100797 [Kwoniella shandongensis]|uniref:Uncharacterized protein n=1 Tax=Kwoniella shandongensis TaxID=1734106 RepID=A0A5M6BUU5_9TREE|nr:uncharacterized protein CI109_005024 [Kwoniella shandongensis]KAA5526634.1 hypothetical protein CI109_005024 [Kwoniella shandongensis]
MSYPIRPSSSRHNRQYGDDRSKVSTKTRKIVITLLILLSLILLGTIIVLSSVSYYLAIPSWAYLTESEVAWKPEDVIKPLKEAAIPAQGLGARNHRREVGSESAVPTEDSTADGVMGTETLPEVWKELEEEMEELDAEEDSEEAPTYAEEKVAESKTTSEVYSGDAVWGIDGEGTGGYWMQREWDGKVKDTNSWDRLFNVTTRPGETIPRLIHQTWKNDHLPEKWQKAWRECREGMPDYEYMLWTDDVSREFIAKHYPAHLHMFDSYEYPIQRADSIRYFVLHHFGGIYMDLDIGCRRRLDPLLQGDWEVILPITKPVGVSNDLIFSSKGSAFMDDTVHGLSAFNHRYATNYPTVMFSTGPMFLSAQYALYSAGHPLTESHPRPEVRILPKSLYGKNTPMSNVPHSFFSHFYGSSWHADDAGFITFLGDWGKKVMWVAAVVIVLGVARLIWIRRKSAGGQQYQLLSILPTTRGDETPTSPTSSSEGLPAHLQSEIASVFKRAGNLILAAPATLLSGDRRGRRKTGLLYFVPALFQPGPLPRRGRTASEASQIPLRRSRSRRERDKVAPPPYDQIQLGDEASRSGKPIDGGVGLGVQMGDSAMDEVDAFLHEADTEGEGEGSGSSYADEDEREWPEWAGKAEK